MTVFGPIPNRPRCDRWLTPHCVKDRVLRYLGRVYILIVVTRGGRLVRLVRLW